MKLIVGLGNPGKKYARTRHNAGFMLVDKLRESWNFPAFELNKKIDTEISIGKISVSSRGERSETEGSNKKIILAKPMTFMNNSGTAVKKIMDFYKLTPTDIIVVHDDLDINLGEYKISTDSRAAGHNGVQDIMDKIGTQEFKRVRIGIEGEEKRKNRLMPSEDFVLQNFTDEEMDMIQNLFPEIISFLRHSLN